ncbi:carboxylesterase/lipase family protein [Pseudonocardia sp. TRM90224]|uniref:carboxylesterase/lipase family protein n=1 Tax=Pseudonocardia sp. TRM90224 TaxID=2812678 RepID=UPI001E5F2C6B|nr:carboxylesterase family protein [Pseudonocardia sp. TRM90224]
MTVARPQPDVRTSSGPVRGTWESGTAVFRGIPFAEPPVGALRFAAPRPARPWGDVRGAVEFGPPPPQADAFGMAALSGHSAGDWLTINVWSPDPGRAAALPVMVWIQGGAYTIGMSGLPQYDGGRLARDGVVLVTFNYRVGMEGFALVEGAPANRGLLDQVAALRWVRENIAAFGGDPDRVTIFGQSAGGGSVAALLAMPSAVGLFHRAVAQSVQGTFFAPELAADIAAACADELGLRPTAAELAEVPPEMLPELGDAVVATIGQRAPRWGCAALATTPFAPVVDGEVLPGTPWQALATGTGRDVELLVGHTRDEHRLLSMIEGVLGEVTPEMAATTLAAFAPGPEGARRYRDGYPDAGPDELYELVRSDWLFRMPSLFLAEAQVAAGGRAHLYELTWEGELGACHGLDVPLVFGNLESGQPAMLIGDRHPTAEALSAHMRAAWTAFAEGGDPGWPAYDAEHRLAQLFDSTPSVTAYPEEASRLIWQDHPFPVMSLLGG